MVTRRGKRVQAVTLRRTGQTGLWMYKETGDTGWGCLYGTVEEKKWIQRATGTVANSESWSNKVVRKMNYFISCSFNEVTYKTKQTTARRWNYWDKKWKIFTRLQSKKWQKLGYRQHIEVNNIHHSKTVCLINRMFSIFSRGHKRESLPNWKKKNQSHVGNASSMSPFRGKYLKLIPKRFNKGCLLVLCEWDKNFKTQFTTPIQEKIWEDMP